MWRPSPAWSTEAARPRRQGSLPKGARRHIVGVVIESCASPGSPGAADQSGLFLDAVLAPHRSLPPAGFAAVMAVLGGCSLCAGTLFVLNGAWPVTGFFGLDVALVYAAFRVNYRSARRQERVRLSADALTVERIGVRGDRRRWSFQPYWLRVVFEEKDEDTNRLLITSHGRSLVLGSFLGAGERRRFAGRLGDALARWRAQLSAG
ncbi:MAG: DUF2244 domain-containing protein [Alphaproteobacteria bacterium]|nr:DUF2244 domain-containing protein [Alphaproteobacteria bacterium]